MLDLRLNFGAIGNGQADDTAAFQAACDYVDPLAGPGFDGVTIYVPPGTYRVVAQANKAAVLISKRNTVFLGAGGPQRGASHVVVDGSGTALDCGFLIERNGGPNPGGDGSQLRYLTIGGGAVKPVDLVVIHGHKDSISDCVIRDCKRYGVLIESGTTKPGGGLLGVSEAAINTQHFPDFWRLSSIEFMNCGDRFSGGGNLAAGAAVYVHGGDTNGGLATGLSSTTANVAFADHSLGGCVWVACYSQQANVGYHVGLGAAVLVGCGTEDVQACIVQNGSAAMAVGGALSVEGAFQHRVSPTSSRLSFSRPGGASDPTSVYGAQLPGDDSFVDFKRSRVAQPTANPPIVAFYEQWRLRFYTLTANVYAYLKGAFGFALTHNGAAQLAPAIGWTSAENVRGKGLPFFGNPAMNTRRHWSHAQTFTMPTGAKTVYLQPSDPAAPFAPWPGYWPMLDDPATEWPKARSAISTSVTAAPATLVTNDVRVGLTSLFAQPPPNAHGRNAAVRIENVGPPLQLTIVWQYKCWVESDDTNA